MPEIFTLSSTFIFPIPHFVHTAHLSFTKARRFSVGAFSIAFDKSDKIIQSKLQIGTIQISQWHVLSERWVLMKKNVVFLLMFLQLEVIGELALTTYDYAVWTELPRP